MSWQNNIGAIKEIYAGHYQIVLDFATNAFLNYVLRDDYKYVWVYNHHLLNSLNWQECLLPLVDNENSYPVFARKLVFDFAMETKDFKQLLPKLHSGINLLQINLLPKYYLDLSQIQGKTRYDLLAKECDYLYEIDIPSATDYGTLISSNREWLQSLIDNKEIDWNNLP